MHWVINHDNHKCKIIVSFSIRLTILPKTLNTVIDDYEYWENLWESLIRTCHGTEKETKIRGVDMHMITHYYFWYLLIYHGTIIRTGITCKKIPCYMRDSICRWRIIKGTPLCLSQLLATESPVEMMKKAFYFTLKALFSLKIFKFLSWLFGQVEKWLD